MSAIDAETPEDVSVGRVELLGAKIENFGPIRRCYVPLDSSFTVLYGLNGAGKSHVLAALATGFGRGSSVDGKVTVHFRAVDGFDLSSSVHHDPWDPWQALWTGVRSYITSELSNIKMDVGFPLSMDQLTLEFAEHHVLPLLSRLAGQEIPTPQLYRDLPRFVEMITQFLIASNPGSYYEWDARNAAEGFDADAPVFFPIFEAAFEGRMMVTTRNGERSVALGRAQEGDATREWAARVRDFVRERMGTRDPAEEAREAFGRLDEQQGVELIAAFERQMELAERNGADELTAPSGHDQGSGFANAIEDYETYGAESLSEELSDKFGPYLERCLQWDSVIAEALGVGPPPVWAADTVLTCGDDPGPLPFAPLNESDGPMQLGTVRELLAKRSFENEDDLTRFLVSSIEGTAADRDPREKRRRSFKDEQAGLHLLVLEEGGAYSVDPQLGLIASTLEVSANHIFRTLMARSPRLICRVAPIYAWADAQPIEWSAVDASGAEFASTGLSAAEYRWALFSLRLADVLETRDEDEPVIVFIDEPERALHRRAERELANGLASLASTLNLRLVVASHSPAFLAHRPASLQHVRRADDGTTIVEPVPDEFFDRADELGLDPTDLLQMCRALLLVEGQHELVILDELIGSELRDLGVEMLCMRGAKALKGWDAQLVQRYTDVPFIVLVDNDQSSRLNGIWNRAREAAERNEDHFSVIDELKSGSRGSEGEFLRELCKNLIAGSDADRYHITAFQAADVPEYLPPAVIAPGVNDKTWEQLRIEAGSKAERSTDFKAWMKKSYAADYSDEALRRAARSMDSIPEDFTQLLERLRTIVSFS